MPENTGAFCCRGCEVIYSLLHKGDNSVVAEETERLNQHLIERLKANLWRAADDQDFRKIHSFNRTQTEYRLFLKGISCSLCSLSLEGLSEALPEVSMSRLNIEHSILHLQLKDPSSSLAKVLNLVEEMGFKIVVINPQENPQAHQDSENRIAVKRIAITGFLAGNIMLFSASQYLGVSGELSRVFDWCQLILFLPVLLYSGRPFYEGAIRSIRSRHMSIDFPMAVALSLGSWFSIANLIRGSHQIYFDSTASFLFLILASRYLSSRLIQKGKVADFELCHPQNQTVEVIDSDPGLNQSPAHVLDSTVSQQKESTRRVMASSLTLGQHYRLTANQILPCDSILVSDSCEVDSSQLSGESVPRVFFKGAELLSGSKLLSHDASFQVVRSSSVSYMQELQRKYQSALLEKSKIMGISDRLSGLLLVFVLLIAAGFAVWFWPVNSEQAISRSLALIIVACPCALALGTPLAYMRGLQECYRRGIHVRSPHVFEKLNQIENWFFDKTGTLTTGNLRLSSNNPMIDDELKSVMLGLEAKSNHPIALCLRRFWRDHLSAEVFNLQEHPGSGVSGQVQGRNYQLQNTLDSESGEVSATLFRDQRKLVTIRFIDSPRATSKDTLTRLRKIGKQLKLVTGDHRASALQMGTELGFAEMEIFSEMSPEKKLAQVQPADEQVFVGDGINDSLAMAGSTVSVIMRRGLGLQPHSADVSLPSDRPELLTVLLEISGATKKILIRNWAWSIIYNGAAGLGALLGHVDPLAAALLMPMSSLVMIGITFMTNMGRVKL